MTGTGLLWNLLTILQGLLKNILLSLLKIRVKVIKIRVKVINILAIKGLLELEAKDKLKINYKY